MKKSNIPPSLTSQFSLVTIRYINVTSNDKSHSNTSKVPIQFKYSSQMSVMKSYLNEIYQNDLLNDNNNLKKGMNVDGNNGNNNIDDTLNENNEKFKSKVYTQNDIEMYWSDSSNDSDVNEDTSYNSDSQQMNTSKLDQKVKRKSKHYSVDNNNNRKNNNKDNNDNDNENDEEEDDEDDEDHTVLIHRSILSSAEMNVSPSGHPRNSRRFTSARFQAIENLADRFEDLTTDNVRLNDSTSTLQFTKAKILSNTTNIVNKEEEEGEEEENITNL